MSRTRDLFEAIVELRSRGERAALATIVRRLGSTPRKDNAKMLIRSDGSALGSVGGGCVEAQVWQAAGQVMESGQGQLLRYQLTDDDAAEEGLVCGGTVEVFVEPIMPDPKVVILGAGHVGQAIARGAHQVNYRVVVVDDRENFANSDRFPWAEEIVVQPFDTGLSKLGISPEDFILIVTRGHSHDQVALRSAIETPARYLGLVGSRRKIQILVRNLLAEGHAREAFRNLYAPIGLEIGSETPEEIGVSVVAELIALQKGFHRRSKKQQFIVDLLDKEASTAEVRR